MVDPWVVEVISTVGLAVALAACAGLRAWLPLLLAGALSRAGLLQLGDSFKLLGSNAALAVFGLATVIELVGDKVPAVDHALDVFSTFVRPAAGAVLAASVFGRIADPLQSLALGIAVGAPAALVPHAGKTVVRAASTAFTGGLASPILSLVEDGLTVVLFFVAVLVPVVTAVALIVVGLAVARRILPRRTAPAVAR
jgi:hypothetical protein